MPEQIKFGDIVVDIEISGIKEKITEIMASAEKEYPNSPTMQAHEIESQLTAFIKIATFRTKLSKIGTAE